MIYARKLSVQLVTGGFISAETRLDLLACGTESILGVLRIFSGYSTLALVHNLFETMPLNCDLQKESRRQGGMKTFGLGIEFSLPLGVQCG